MYIQIHIVSSLHICKANIESPELAYVREVVPVPSKLPVWKERSQPEAAPRVLPTAAAPPPVGRVLFLAVAQLWHVPTHVHACTYHT